MSVIRRCSTAFALLLGLAWMSQPALAAHKGVSNPPDVMITLKTHIGEKGMGYVGVGGNIDGVIDPTLKLPVGAVVQITLINGDGAEHDIAVPAFDALSEHVTKKDASTVIVFRAGKEGEFEYFCTLPGHKQAGMYGKIIVGQPKAVVEKLPDVSRDPADVAKPVGKRAAKTVDYSIESFEEKAQLDDGTSYTYWTFDKKIPGPMLRVRVGDTVNIHFKNDKSSRMIHSIDFHAVTGPGGGANLLQVPPGGQKTLTFKALKPGVYVYHCATPMVAQHIANGMFGLIVVEPEGGLPKADKEFYVMQSEIYTVGAHGQHGYQEFDVKKLLAEEPSYFVFNGAVGALSKHHPLTAKTGDDVRIFFGVGGPNFTSSFHVIGEIFDRVYNLGSFTSPPVTDVQTVMVPPGGATVVDFTPEVPGNYILVDHALARAELGLSGVLQVSGKERPDIYKGDGPMSHVGH